MAYSGQVVQISWLKHAKITLFLNPAPEGKYTIDDHFCTEWRQRMTPVISIVGYADYGKTTVVVDMVTF
jgi:hypothetical protein